MPTGVIDLTVSPDLPTQELPSSSPLQIQNVQPLNTEENDDVIVVEDSLEWTRTPNNRAGPSSIVGTHRNASLAQSGSSTTRAIFSHRMHQRVSRTSHNQYATRVEQGGLTVPMHGTERVVISNEQDQTVGGLANFPPQNFVHTRFPGQARLVLDSEMITQGTGGQGGSPWGASQTHTPTFTGNSTTIQPLNWLPNSHVLRVFSYLETTGRATQGSSLSASLGAEFMSNHEHPFPRHAQSNDNAVHAQSGPNLGLLQTFPTQPRALFGASIPLSINSGFPASNHPVPVAGSRLEYCLTQSHPKIFELPNQGFTPYLCGSKIEKEEEPTIFARRKFYQNTELSLPGCASCDNTLNVLADNSITRPSVLVCGHMICGKCLDEAKIRCERSKQNGSSKALDSLTQHCETNHSNTDTDDSNESEREENKDSFGKWTKCPVYGCDGGTDLCSKGFDGPFTLYIT